MFLEVYLFDLPYHLDRAFDYSSDENIEIGSFVRVPFGRGDRLRLGIVMGLKDSTESANVKPVHSVTLESYRLTEHMLGLCLFLKEHTLCTLGEAIRTILPPGLLNERENVSIRRECVLMLSADRAEELMSRGGRAGIRSEGQKRIINYLIGKGKCDYDLIRAIPGVTSAHIAALRDKEYIEITEHEHIRNPYEIYAYDRDTSDIVLSRAQNEAFDTIMSLYESDKAECALLHGVTGSGKTKVIMKAIDRCISDGHGVIMLVPEIALTPQTVGLFCRRYGERVAVIHSSLSQGERSDAYRRIRRGDVDLVIGTRSAIFAPLSDIGLIVIDEEHEHTYKSESDPKYHARDVAAYLCGRHGALLLLASATPALESYYKAKQGIYTLIPIKERYGGVTLPDAVVVDMREELRLGNTSPLSDRLLRSLKKVSEHDEQAILFLNRRGFNSQVSCRGCGDVITCKRCSVSLTYHTDSHGGRMMCHMCGYTSAVPRACPSCGEEKLAFLGYGTQKVESDLAAYLPESRVMRMDADTTQGKLAYDRLLEDYRAGNADILLGTQMVAKGHDFPRVTLVGVILADTSLYVSDFRAAERTFSLLTQVIGRAGRAKSGGTAVIQTYSPKNEIIRLACMQDYEAFYEGEIELRRELLFPPFCDLVSLSVTSSDERETLRLIGEVSDKILSLLKGELGKLPFVVFAPTPAGVYRVNEKYRMRIVIKCRLSPAVRRMFGELLRDFSKAAHSATLSVDFNPLSL